MNNKNTKNTGNLYIVPTPIGNLEDITYRAVRILAEVDIIACEDTRVTQKLLNHYGISTKLTSYHKFSEKQKGEQIINLVKSGKDIALVSDAGTPLISDPGSELIKLANQNNIKIIPLPGASALTTAVCVAFNQNTEFVFSGFLSKSKSQKELLLKKYSDINSVFYESPSRLIASLNDIFEILGNRTITVARELTKIYEEIKTDSVENLIDYYKNKPPKGEIVLIIHGEPLKNNRLDLDTIKKINALKNAGYSTKDISKIISLTTDISKNEVYNFLADFTR